MPSFRLITLKHSLLVLSVIALSSCGGDEKTTTPASAAAPAPVSALQRLFAPAPNISSTVANFNGNRSSYTITNNGSGYTVKDNVGTDGTVSLATTTQQLIFKDVSVNLQIESLASSIASSDLNAIIELYIAYFNRIPDSNGLAYWINQFKSGVSIEKIGESFYIAAIQDAALTGYAPNANNVDFVTNVYRNVLSRTPPDKAGLDYWTNGLANGSVTRGIVVRSMLIATHGYAGDPVYGWVNSLFENKVSVAKNFAIQQGLTYLRTEDSITKGMALASTVTPTDTSVANGLIQALVGFQSNNTNAPTPAQASRFLAQASFGANNVEINSLANSSYKDWIDKQLVMPQKLHRSYMEAQAAGFINGLKDLNQNHFFESFWQQAIKGDDQLRQRVTFALSQIFVISFQDSNVANYPRGVAAYYDTLSANAFGNFRNLLEAVSLHPMMGTYLTSLRNQKESGTQVPDENYAREVMQLFTIGLYQLNQDGTYIMNGGKPVETYTSADITGLAKVFTGWSWAGPDKSDNRFFGGNADANREWLPMQGYPKYHSVTAKTFLGVTIPAQSPANPDASLKIALDTLFNHQNVGPFIGKQLIQRLVTSNPSPQYISRVAAAFNNNGSGVRGDMRAVIKAILLDNEARNDTTLTFSNTGKLREPVLRLANWMRAFNVNSTSGRFLMTSLDDPLTGLAETPMRSPSVFNFYRPGYVPPNSGIANAGLVSPEMQITGETSVVGYLNFMRDVIPNGTGSSRDVKGNYTNLIALAATPDQLIDQLSLTLMANQMSSNLRSQILTAVNSVTIPTNNTANADTAKKNRVYLSIFLTMASPEYLVQK
ncbi:DUF1800 family protein [Undibacterium sp.]|uniref:DUF1800 family protein n=1 Tax=Undibacterium sp. TaxID=1914977 RepID=UPI00272F47E0|nr:DUF1800 family protein [Undibacterium sp.]MDP1977973.1 DUF1800 family protein [Undibacterium sp.]